MREIPDQAIDLIKRYEGLSLTKYIDSDGFPTIGYGHKLVDDEDYETITEEEALILLKQDVSVAANSVLRLTNVPLTDNEYAALIDFVYNLGAGSYQASTLRMVINRGDFKAAPRQFKRWVYGNGVKLPGLVLRRQKEAELFNEV